MQTMPSKLSTDAIATAAYYHWVNAGKPAGRDQEFWLQAETELGANGKPVRIEPFISTPKNAATPAGRAKRKLS